MDALTVAVAVGLVVSFFFSEMYGLAAGGLIVPGYLALSLDRPAGIVMTLLAALVTFAIVKLISKFAIVYGRRRIVLMMIVGFCVGAALSAAAASLWTGLSGEAADQPWLTVIGFIIPGLIALWIDRQGLAETVAPLTTAAVVVRLALITLGMETLA